MTQNTSSDTTVATTSPFLLTLLTTSGSAALRIKNSELPSAIQVDEKANHEVARRIGAGVQVYDCDPAKGTFTFREPQADLYDLDTAIQRGIHFVGPEPGTAQWADADGSRVVARVVARVDAPPPADPSKDVQWLQVEAFQNFGTGIFNDVTFIQRVLTHGGKAPPSCASGTTTSRRYTALYIFWAAGAAPIPQAPNSYHQTNLISNRTDQGAQVVDPNLQNPWGLAFGPTNPLWVADNNVGVATVYTVNAGGTEAAKHNLTVALPGGRASTGDGPSPTGQVFNPTTGFVVSSPAGTGSAAFIFSAEAGQISAWNSAADPVANGMSTAQVVFSSPTAVYKGLTIATMDEGTFLYASNFHDGTVDVFDRNFHQVHLLGDFADPSIPADYAPFGIQAINGLIYVTYAEQDAQEHDDVAGPGHGFIDIFTTDGLLVKRLASRGTLNSPWGLARAPAGFGPFSGRLLVGNFGDGRINAFDQFSGDFAGQLDNEHGEPITIDGLWGLRFGTATTGGTTTLLFSAGINAEKDGLVGSINAAQ
jgi:uncharacterized protein (TIGR03118 family)